MPRMRVLLVDDHTVVRQGLRKILESDDEIEREANRFAAELLMPEELLRSRATELRHRTGYCPRSVLEYRLAAELLVSQQALSYRLKDLEVGDE